MIKTALSDFKDHLSSYMKQAVREEIVITNTVPMTPDRFLPNMHILSVASVFAEAIRRAAEYLGIAAANVVVTIHPELIVLGISVFGAWSMTAALYAGHETSWHVIRTDSYIRLSMAGVWYLLVAVPLLQFMFYRWIWRLIIWTGFLRDMSRLNLRLVVSHPDQAGGLGFLGMTQVSFGSLAFGLGSILSGSAAFLIVFHGVNLEAFKIPFGAYLVLVNLIFLGPLLVFVPLLARTRRQGLREFSTLAGAYNNSFMEKWIRGRAPEGETLLGSSDIQSLADLGNSFGMIREMKIFPFSQQQILQIAVVACLPGLPLIFLVMPVGEILQLLAGALL